MDWKVTATTIYCEDVDDEVTIIVNRDGSVRCVGFSRYGTPDKDTAALLRRKSRQFNRRLGCNGSECRHATRYRDQLFAEEANQAGTADSA
jgi:hypothetical protein